MKTIPPMNSPILMIDGVMGMIIRHIGDELVGVQVAGKEEIYWLNITEITDIGGGALAQVSTIEDPAKVRLAIQQLEKISAHVDEVNEMVEFMKEFDLDRALVMEIENQKLAEAQHIINAGYHYQITWLIGSGIPMCRIRDLVNTALQVEHELREEQERNR